MKKLRRNKKHGYHHAHWFDDLYRQNYYLFVGETGFTQYLRSLAVTVPDVTFQPGCVGKCLELLDDDDAQRGLVIALKTWELNPFHVGILAHECLHAVTRTFGPRGVDVRMETDEPAAYYLNWLVERCMECLATLP